MNIPRLEIREIIQKIQQKQFFEALSPDGGFKIKINRYVPFCCLAVHNGGRLRPELKKKIALNDYQRWFEEDPHTEDFIVSMPITLVGNDSRYEYDLNRGPDQCIYDMAWGRKVWKRDLNSQEIKTSLQKHTNYYKVLHALIEKLEELFGGCIVYDIHSYNYKRWNKDVPLFNIGTERVDRDKFGADIEHWVNELEKISLPDITSTVRENDVFFGRGYNVEYLTRNFSNTLVLATDMKKVYCDESTGDAYPKLIRLLQKQLKQAILNNANHFSRKLEKWHHISSLKLLEKNINEDLLKLDSNLYDLLRNFELLAAVNPVNTATEKRRFFRNRFSELPGFRYNPIKVNPFEMKQKLLSLPLADIQDVSIRSLYEAVINSYFDKIDMLGSLATGKFLYNSLRYFGRPSKKDLQNAMYLLHLPDIPGEAIKEPLSNADEAMAVFKEGLDSYGITAKMEKSRKVISHVMVLNSKKIILFQPDALFRKKELHALVEHEIGVHALTTMNSNQQKLKIFNLGLPVNTHTQEGLAVLAEYLSGNITLRRLKKLALRVVTVDMMCSGADFIECFHELVSEYEVEQGEAFNIVTRVFRGGGFTKDYLYLAGFVKILRFWEQQHDLAPLLIGKISLHYYSTIEEMMGREMVTAPRYITHSFTHPQTERNNPIYNYILSGLK